MIWKFDPSLTREIYASMIACQLTTCVGVTMGYSAYLIPQLISSEPHIAPDLNIASWIVSIGAFFSAVGALSEVFLIDLLGRRGTILLNFGIFASGWLITGLANSTVILCIGRILVGFALGMISLVNIYISETVSVKRRATFISYALPSSVTGTALVYLLEYFFTWRQTSFILTGHSVVLFIFTWSIPETTFWCTLKDKKKRAIASIIWFRRCTVSEAEVQHAELHRQISERARENHIPYHELFKDRLILKPFLAILGGYYFLGQAGFDCFLTYAVDIFNSLKTPYDGDTLAVIFGVVNAIGVISCSVVLHKFNRKTFLFMCCGGMAVCMSIVAIYTNFLKHDKPFPILPAIAIYCHVFLSIGGIYQTLWIIIPEIFPQYATGSMCATIFFLQHVLFSVSIKSYYYIITFIGFSGIPWYYLCNITCLIILVYTCIPETKNVPLKVVQQYYGSDQISKKSELPSIDINLKTVNNNVTAEIENGKE